MPTTALKTPDLGRVDINGGSWVKKLLSSEPSASRVRKLADRVAQIASRLPVGPAAPAVVIDKRADVGDTVSPGQVLVSLYDKMQLIANVREGLMKNLKTGQNIGVYIDDIGEACEGKISEIVPQADPATRTFLVKVVGECHAGVRPGMYAKLLVPLGDKQVLVIPPAAIVQVGQLTMVDVAGGKALERRNVQLGKQIDFGGKPFVQVLSGLRAGEKVAIGSQGEDRHGQ